MQTDAGFIENVENASQTGADLCREAYPLRFAAGKRAALAIQCEIAEPDLDEKLQARANLADNVCYDGLLLLGQVETANESQRVFHVLLAELMDIQFAVSLPAVASAEAGRALIVTARISGLSLAPPQTLHVSRVMNARMRLRVNSLSVCS